MKRILFVFTCMLLLFSCEYQDNGITSIDNVITSDYLLTENLDTFVSQYQIVRLTGKPGTTTISIGGADLSKYQPCFVLYVATGTTPETTASSAIIKLDGMVVLSTSDFSKNAGQYKFEVCNLCPTSVLTVEVRGEPGSYVSVWIEGKLKEVDADGDGFTVTEGDCDGANPSIYPGAEEICGDGIDQDCNGTDILCPEDIDDDGDGFTENQGDCNDSEESIHPGAEEICSDEIDQDCNGTDMLCPVDIDNDNDGYTLSEGDCNDSNPNIHPGAYEVCNGIDDNCNGQVDGSDIPDAILCPPTDHVIYTICEGVNGCKPICENGWYDCNGYLGDGCETQACWLANPNYLPNTIFNNPTSTSIEISWESALCGTGYRITVSQDPSGTPVVNSYDHLDVGNVLNYTITGLVTGKCVYVSVQVYDCSSIYGSWLSNVRSTCDF